MGPTLAGIGMGAFIAGALMSLTFVMTAGIVIFVLALAFSD